MKQCRHCEGFVPAGFYACPHCDARLDVSASASDAEQKRGGLIGRLGQRARNTALGLGAGTLMMTLMACYGMPPEAICKQWEDKDGDGARVCADVGYMGQQEDCDDNDKTRHPGAEDTAGDGIDQNCDGVDGIAQ
ncbi:MAG: hypothetical protein H6728_17955 [Myxococcales bacterium]|nr:hypothetical protein [Myxococcales bacterium]MCB9644959.1 hypothetical protein [Myxococcales bacterium]